MNRQLFLAATVGLLALTSCSAQQRQMFHNVQSDDKPSESVLNEGLTLVVNDVAVNGCAPDNGACSPAPLSDPALAPFNCENGTDNGACLPAPESNPNLPPPVCENCIRP